MSEPRSDDMSDDELDALAAEVRKDLREGRGAKHFEDVLDELHSSQHQESNSPDAAERERLERMEQQIMRDLKQQSTLELLSHGMRVTVVQKDGHGAGWIAKLKDAEGREYEAFIKYDAANRLTFGMDAHGAFRAMVDELVREALHARRRYFRRACILIDSNDYASEEAAS